MHINNVRLVLRTQKVSSGSTLQKSLNINISNVISPNLPLNDTDNMVNLPVENTHSDISEPTSIAPNTVITNKSPILVRKAQIETSFLQLRKGNSPVSKKMSLNDLLKERTTRSSKNNNLIWKNHLKGLNSLLLIILSNIIFG